MNTMILLTSICFSDLFFYPGGAGMIKACVNIMGAQQFRKCSLPRDCCSVCYILTFILYCCYADPVLQKGAIEKFYINFYMSINIGALIGGLSVPVVVAMNPFAGYMIPVVGEIYFSITS